MTKIYVKLTFLKILGEIHRNIAIIKYLKSKQWFRKNIINKMNQLYSKGAFWSTYPTESMPFSREHGTFFVLCMKPQIKSRVSKHRNKINIEKKAIAFPIYHQGAFRKCSGKRF